MSIINSAGSTDGSTHCFPSIHFSVRYVHRCSKRSVVGCTGVLRAPKNGLLAGHRYKISNQCSNTCVFRNSWNPGTVAGISGKKQKRWGNSYAMEKKRETNKEPAYNYGEKRLYNIEEATEFLGIKRSTLYKLFKSGAVTPVKIGTRTLVPKESIDSYVKNLLQTSREFRADNPGNWS